MPVSSALRRLKQDDLRFEASQSYVTKFQASLSCTVRPCLKKKKKEKKRNRF
jgi:hypothetical protein